MAAPPASASAATTTAAATTSSSSSGALASSSAGSFVFDDGGKYSGGSETGRAHGYGVCTGPGSQGEYAGAWQSGFETSGVYTWPNGSEFSGQWMQGKRHGLGVERRGRWLYRGEWTQGTMGRYGVRQCTSGSEAKYEGTWTSGLQDGYGLETYSDGGTYQGQWMKGARHGYGVRKSAPYTNSAMCRPHTASHRISLTSVRSEIDVEQSATATTTTTTPTQNDRHLSPTPHVARSPPLGKPTHHIGFFLTARCVDAAEDGGGGSRRGSFLARQVPQALRASLSGGDQKLGLKRQRSAADAETPSDSSGSGSSGGGLSGRVHRDVVTTDPTAVEVYSGEWKNDKRSGYGVCERSDGLRYEGEWVDNYKCGYGVTTFGGGPDVPGGWREEGKYKNNVLLSPSKKLFLPLRASKVREQIDAAVSAAVRAAQIAVQKSDIANSRMESARSKAELADQSAAKARSDADRARLVAKDVEQRERKSEMQPSRERYFHNNPDDTSTRSNQIGNHHTQNHQPYSDRQTPHKYVVSRTETDSDSGVDVGNDRVMFRDNSLVRRQPYHHPSQHPAPQHPQQHHHPDIGRRSQSGSRSSLSPPTGVDYAHMNHVGPSTRRHQHVDHPQASGRTTPTGGSTTYLDHPQQRHYDGRDLDDGAPQWIDDRDASISDLATTTSAADLTPIDDGSQSGGPSTNSLPHVTGRPSLRYRRDFRCPNLVIFNKSPSGLDMSTLSASRSTDVSSSTVGGGAAPARIVRRRLTLPGIVKYPTPAPSTLSMASDVTSGDLGSVRGGKPATEMYLVENCVRKRIEEDRIVVPEPIHRVVDESHAKTAAPVLDIVSLDGLDPPKPLTTRYRVKPSQLGRCSGRSDLGSLPDVSVVRKLQDLTPIPREEAMMLCQQKRDERKMLLEQQEQMKQRAIVLRFGDLRAWCVQRQLSLFVLVVNTVLSVAFYKLLYE